MMKNIKDLAILLLTIFVSVSFFSCSNDDGNTEQTPSSTYWPRAVNNQWQFNNSAGATTTYEMSSTTNFQGRTFYMMDQELSIYGYTIDGQQGVAQSGSTYYAYVPDLQVDVDGYTINFSAFGFTLLNEDLEVGESITTSDDFTLSYSIIQTDIVAEFTSTILAKDIDLEVNGVTYNNVIQVALLSEYTYSGETESALTTYYLAKDIGPIQIEQGQQVTLELINYTLN